MLLVGSLCRPEEVVAAGLLLSLAAGYIALAFG